MAAGLLLADNVLIRHPLSAATYCHAAVICFLLENYRRFLTPDAAPGCGWRPLSPVGRHELDGVGKRAEHRDRARHLAIGVAEQPEAQAEGQQVAGLVRHFTRATAPPCASCPVSTAAWNAATCRALCSEGMIKMRVCPTASWLLKPNSRSAAAFQDVIVPPQSTVMIASPAAATARPARGCGLQRSRSCQVFLSASCAWAKVCRLPGAAHPQVT